MWCTAVECKPTEALHLPSQHAQESTLATTTSTLKVVTPVSPEEKVIPKKHTKEVHFGTITIRRYEQTLGDHPVCSIGPPVTLDWNYEEGDHRPTFDRFERAKTGSRKVKLLNYYTRVGILEANGFTERQLRKVTREVTKIQIQRKATSFLSPFFMPVSDAAETVVRRTKRIVTTSPSRKSEYWEQQIANGVL
jgi:hypothetical protein